MPANWKVENCWENKFHFASFSFNYRFETTTFYVSVRFRHPGRWLELLETNVEDEHRGCVFGNSWRILRRITCIKVSCVCTFRTRRGHYLFPCIAFITIKMIKIRKTAFT